jgi:hypothetical protein
VKDTFWHTARGLQAVYGRSKIKISLRIVVILIISVVINSCSLLNCIDVCDWVKVDIMLVIINCSSKCVVTTSVHTHKK